MSLQSRAAAVAAVLILSLTLGAGAAILALVDAVLLTPPPFADPDSLVLLSEAPSNDPASERRATYGTFEQWRDAAGSIRSRAINDAVCRIATGGRDDCGCDRCDSCSAIGDDGGPRYDPSQLNARAASSSRLPRFDF